MNVTRLNAAKSKMADPTRRLAKFRDAVKARYGARIERMVLFGSRARGDARRGSDYDIAIFLKDIGSEWEEVRRIAAIRFLTLDNPEAVHVTLRPAESWEDRSPLMHEIRRDALDL